MNRIDCLFHMLLLHNNERKVSTDKIIVIDAHRMYEQFRTDICDQRFRKVYQEKVMSKDKWMAKGNYYLIISVRQSKIFGSHIFHR